MEGVIVSSLCPVGVERVVVCSGGSGGRCRFVLDDWVN